MVTLWGFLEVVIPAIVHGEQPSRQVGTVTTKTVKSKKSVAQLHLSGTLPGLSRLG